MKKKYSEFSITWVDIVLYALIVAIIVKLALSIAQQ